MGASGSSSKKQAHPRKNDKLAFANNPGMLKNQNPSNAVRSTHQGKTKSIVLQRRYRDDSLAEESVSVYSYENKTPQTKEKGVDNRKNDNDNNNKQKKQTPIVKEKNETLLPLKTQRNVAQRKPPMRNNYNDNTRPKRKVLQPNEIIRQPVYQRQQRNKLFKGVNTFSNNIPVVNDISSNEEEFNQNVERINRIKDNDMPHNSPYISNNHNYNTNNNTCHRCGLTKYNNTNINYNCQCHHHNHHNHNYNCKHNCNCNCNCTYNCGCMCNYSYNNHNNTCKWHITNSNCFTLGHSTNPIPPYPLYEHSFPLPDTKISIKHRKPRPHFTKQQPVTDLSPLIEHDAYDAITFEYNKHKSFLSSSEKHKRIPLPKPSYSSLYHIAYRIHKSSIVCFLSLTPRYESIHYITSSTDNTIKLWDDNFLLISTIYTERGYSTCLIHYKTEYVLSSEGIYIYAYHLSLPNKIKYIFRGHTDMILHLLHVDDDVFISAGKDTTIRMWKSNPEIVIRYYDGHYSAVRKVVKVYNERNYVSYGDDKKIIIWESEQSSAINVMDVYYTCCDVVGTHFGFITGSYDNKIRMYSMREMNGEMFALFEMDWSYYSRCFVVGNYDESVYLFTNYSNEVVAMDAKERSAVGLFRGPGKECKINAVVKDYYWENSSEGDETCAKNFIGACDDGCVFVWSFDCNEEKGHERGKLPEIFNMLSDGDEEAESGERKRKVSLSRKSRESEREITVDENMVMRSTKGNEVVKIKENEKERGREESRNVRSKGKDEIVKRKEKDIQEWKENELHNENGKEDEEEGNQGDVRQYERDKGKDEDEKGKSGDKNVEKENRQNKDDEEEEDERNEEVEEEEENEQDEEEEENEEEEEDKDDQDDKSQKSKALLLKSLPESSRDSQVKQEGNQINVIQPIDF